MCELNIGTQVLHHFRLSWRAMNKGDRQGTVTEAEEKARKWYPGSQVQKVFQESDQLCWIMLKGPGGGIMINDHGIWQHVDHCWPWQEQFLNDGWNLTEMVQERMGGQKVEIENIKNFSVKDSC